jgi:hypothetical protein
MTDGYASEFIPDSRISKKWQKCKVRIRIRKPAAPGFQSSSTVLFTTIHAAAMGAFRFSFTEWSWPLVRVGIAAGLELDP